MSSASETAAPSDAFAGDGASQIKAAWPAVISLALGVFGLATAEFLPASLLTPIASDLAVSIGAAGQAVTGLSRSQKLLIGAYFCQEYAYEAAALFNPSAVLHPDQSGLVDGTVRFILSLRGIGEGHVSSVTFRTGTWTPGSGLTIDDPGTVSVPPHIRPDSHEAASFHLDCGGSRSIAETVLFPLTASQR